MAPDWTWARASNSPNVIQGDRYGFQIRGNGTRRRNCVYRCSPQTPGNYILFLGRMSPERGSHLPVEAFEQIETDVKLVMAGASSCCDECSRELRMHANDRIRIFGLGFWGALDKLLTNAMILVLPSDLEGLSLALLDAMGVGLCVLTSDVRRIVKLSMARDSPSTVEMRRT